MRLVYSHDFKHEYHASQTATNINRAWGEEFTCDRTVP